jgi:chorismate-pyruvate lyase
MLPMKHTARRYAKTDATVWGRRSVFRVAGKPLLVSEYFLPELLKQE